jgi:DNA-nicking Smr family endonuclease
MSASGQKPRKTTERSITDDEAELWQHATRTLEQIKAKPRVATGNASPAVPSRRAAPQTPAKTTPEKARARLVPERPALPGRKRPPAPLADFERRKARQIASGRIEVDARVDLHGSHQRDAHARLRAFLMQAQAAGHKTVLVITGKGDAEPRADRLGPLLSERPRGILRQNVPRWLEEPDLRPIVLSYTQASAPHGGSGALYVRLRKGAR